MKHSSNWSNCSIKEKEKEKEKEGRIRRAS
jgi:hypothetical protein